MASDLEQQARGLLAAALRKHNENRLAGMAEIPQGLDQIATHIALDAIVAALRSQPNVSDLTRQLIDRDRKGREKYGTTLDRRDLAPADWAQHMAEELMDAAGYALALKREILAAPDQQAVPEDVRRDVATEVAAAMREYLDQDVEPGFDVIERWADRLAAQPQGEDVGRG